MASNISSFVSLLTKQMLILLVLVSVFPANQLQPQTWTSVDFPSNMVWSADELSGKLYVATMAHGIYEYDGSTWNYLVNYNNSLNTPNKSKQSVKNIDNLLYFGARDFNTIGEGIFHTYDGTAFSNFQNSRFPYNANYRVNCIEKYNGVIYAAGQLRAPGTANLGYNIIKWNGTEWVGISELSNISPNGEQTNPVSKMMVYNNKLYVISQNNIYHFNGSVWDSLNLGQFVSVFDASVYNNELYITGNFFGGAVGNHKLIKFDGTTLTGITVDYDQMRRLFGDATGLYAVVTHPHPSFQGDAALVKYDGSVWSTVSLLAPYNTGYIPGYEIYDYNIIFRYAGGLYVGGRFPKINNQTIQSLARLDIASDIKSSEGTAPTQFVLEQNYPNPFNPSTTISYSINQKSWVKLSIYNTTGNLVCELLNKVQEKGIYNFQFDTVNLASGVYFYTLNANGFSTTKKMTLIK